MYCPKCSQEQLSEETRFCSRCGFLLTGIAEVIENNGEIPRLAKQEQRNLSTPRKKGLKQGLFMLSLTTLLGPVLLFLAVTLNIKPGLFILTMFVLFAVSVVRMLYAKLFESGEPADAASGQIDFQTARNHFSGKKNGGALPAAQSGPVSDFIPPAQGNWRDTNDLVYSNVIDISTKQLGKK